MWDVYYIKVKIKTTIPVILHSVADSGFLRRREGAGGQPQRGRTNPLFGQRFAENCMKMKEIWIERGDVRN